MKRILTLGVLLLCLAATQTAHAAEDRDAKIKAEMVQNYLLREVAVKNKDAERIISFESPEFKQVMQDGTVRTKAAADADTRLWTSRLRKVYHAKVTIKKIDVESHRVVIWSKRELDADILASGNPKGPQLPRIFVTITTRDIWVRYRDNWVLKRVENLTSKVTIV